MGKLGRLGLFFAPLYAFAVGETNLSLPGSTPTDPDAFMRERDRLEKRLTPPKVSEPFAGTTQKVTSGGKDDAKLSEDDKSLDALNESTGTKGSQDIRVVPVIEMAPPRKVGAYLGQELFMELKASSRSEEPTQYAWILNRKVICRSAKCQIPLNGEDLKIGNYNLIVIAYNSTGSTSSSHVLGVNKSAWKPEVPLQRSLVPAVESRVQIQQATLNKPTIRTMEGNAVLHSPYQITILGTVPRNLEWSGNLKSGKTGVVRIKQGAKEELFVTPSTSVILSQKNDDRSVKVVSGAIRHKSSEASNKKGEHVKGFQIETNEVVVLPELSSDTFVLHIPPESKKMAARRKRKTGEEIPLDEQFKTQIIVVSGGAQIALRQSASKEKAFNLPTGVEFTVYENGLVAPLGRPDPRRMESLLKATLSKNEFDSYVKELAEKLKNVPLEPLIKKIEEQVANEDYFEALSNLKAIEQRTKEDARIAYLAGMSSKGLYQPSEARIYFAKAISLNPKFVKARWELTQMQMDEKDWDGASKTLNEMGHLVSATDPLYPEYLYYTGVVEFNQGSNFTSRNLFTHSLWEKALNQALKSSSANFLGSIAKRKKWNLIVPAGVQYDANALSLPDDTDLSDAYISRATTRLIGGAIFSWDSANGQTDVGMYGGAGAKAIYVKNLDSQYKALDALILEASSSQTFILKNGERLKLTQPITLTMVDQNIATQTFAFTANYKKIDASLFYEHDALKTGTESRSKLGAKQEHLFELSLKSPYPADILLAAEESYALNKNAGNGPAFALEATPGINMPLGNRMSAKGTLLLSSRFDFWDETQTTYKATPGVSLTYFITPWLLGIATAGYEYAVLKPKNTQTKKPGASLMLTGFF